MIIKDQHDEFASYLTDASNLKGNADILYLPETKNELCALIRSLNSSATPFTISGSGTGMTGGRVPMGGVIISMEKFNSIEGFDAATGEMRVGAAVRIKDIDSFANDNGRLYPPNPTESDSSIGGNFAHNSSGSRTYKYGATRNYVVCAEIVLPDGDSLTLRRGEIFAEGHKFSFKSEQGNEYQFEFAPVQMPKVKNASGYYLNEGMDLLDLFIGSEGTLGVLCYATLSTIPKPEQVFGALAFFDTYDSLYAYVKHLKTCKQGIVSPRLIEFFDSNSLNTLRNYFAQLPKEAVGAIWIEQEHTAIQADETMEQWYNLITQYTSFADLTWTAITETEHKKLSEFRHKLPLTVSEMVVQNNQLKIGTDTAVPDEHIRHYFDFINESVKAIGLNYLIFGHIGNSHFHADIFAKSGEEEKIGRATYNKIVSEAIRLGGTVSAEHGIGKIKKQYLAELYGDKVLDEMKRIKAVFDPLDLINRGNLF